jgi:ATP-dependent DNA ligase
MNEETQEIEKLLKQSGELSESLIQLVRKLQQQRMQQANIHEKPLSDITAFKVMMDATAPPEQVIIELLRVEVAEKTITPELAAEQLVNSLRHDLAVSQRIRIREIARAAFSTGDDVFSKVGPFLNEAKQRKSEQQEAGKKIAVAP